MDLVNIKVLRKFLEERGLISQPEKAFFYNEKGRYTGFSDYGIKAAVGLLETELGITCPNLISGCTHVSEESAEEKISEMKELLTSLLGFAGNLEEIHKKILK